MNTEKQTVTTYETRGRIRSDRVGNALAGAAAIGVALAVMHGVGGNEAPEQDIKSYTELAQESAQTPLQEGDTVLVEGIKLDANNSDLNSGSEAVLNSEKTQEFIRQNPDEKAAIQSSAFNLPAVEGYAIVERDIDGDGDGDAIAVPVVESDNK